MTTLLLHIPRLQQYALSVLSIVFVALLCFFFKDIIGYKVVAFILLVWVSLLAMILDIIPTLIAAVLSALIWNYFFIEPYFTFHINDTEDSLLFSMYFIVAMINAVLTFKIKQFQQIANEKEAKLKSVKLYNTLLDSLSHELRTPISAIIGSTDTLQNQDIKLNEEQKDRLINEIQIASLRLNNQVENLLNMSRLESGVIKAKFDWVDVKELVYEVVKQVSQKGTLHKIDVVFSENLPLFKLDLGLTEQVLFNLLYNAVSYTPENSIIKIEILEKESILILVLTDEGRGFPEDEIDFVFDKFYRLKNCKPGGSGLGLSIVKGFVEAQGGIITLENRPERGAKFTIQIRTEVSNLNDIENEQV